MSAFLLALARSVKLTTSVRLRCFSLNSCIERYIEPRGAQLPEDFSFYPEFLNKEDQQILLASALRELDKNGPRRARRNLKRNFSNRNTYERNTSSALDLFLPEDSGCYNFEQGHYDGVIQDFREINLQSWPSDPALDPIIGRLRTLLPSTRSQDDIMTHILHLSSKGRIYPHVDNVESSGSWIAAVSLGHERVLRMEGPNNTFDVLLPSGSAYVQK